MERKPWHSYAASELWIRPNVPNSCCAWLSWSALLVGLVCRLRQDMVVTTC